MPPSASPASPSPFSKKHEVTTPTRLNKLTLVGRAHPQLPRVDATVLPLSPPLLWSPPLEQSLMFTGIPSLGQDAGPTTRMDGRARLGFAPVSVRHGFWLRLQDSMLVLDSPHSPERSESESRVRVSQDDSVALSNAGRRIGNDRTRTGTVAGRSSRTQKLKST